MFKKKKKKKKSPMNETLIGIKMGKQRVDARIE